MQNVNNEGFLPIGTTLARGKYRIERYLASGGFGKTYMATDTAFFETVAIKELYLKGVCGRVADSSEISITLNENQRLFDSQREKFRKEARRLRRLKSDHIVHVHDLFDDNGTSYYVMDYIDGESLGNILKRTNHPFSEEEVLRMLPQMLDALECVHNEKIWHLDLKPANIMLSRQGDIVLIDFGASKQMHSGNGDTTSSTMSYTSGYAPSEQMEQNFDKFGPWTDLYALGATLYRLLTLNQLPTPSDIVEGGEAALPFPTPISAKTKGLILWLMSPSRLKRPQSVAEVRRFLQKAGAAAPTDEAASAQTPQNADERTKVAKRVKPAMPVKPAAPVVPAKVEEAVVVEAVVASERTRILPSEQPARPAQPKPHVAQPAPKQAQPKPQHVQPQHVQPQHVQPQPIQPQHVDEVVSSVSDYEPPQGNGKKWVFGFLALAICAGAAAFFLLKDFKDEKPALTNTDTLEVVDREINLVSRYNGPDTNPGEHIYHTLGVYTYTGQVTMDSLKRPLPNGLGKATFPDGRTYEGTFVDGFCEGRDAKFKVNDEETFTGEMSQSQFVKGRYDVHDGSYYEGTFKNYKNWNGAWHNADGTISRVIDGEEQPATSTEEAPAD